MVTLKVDFDMTEADLLLLHRTLLDVARHKQFGSPEYALQMKLNYMFETNLAKFSKRRQFDEANERARLAKLPLHPKSITKK
jgi:hypothetical protein